MTNGGDQQKKPDRTEPLAPPEAEAVLRFASLKRGALFAGRYEVLGLLGSGGAGEVYRVRDRISLEEVALKVLYPRADHAGHPLERLRRELRIVRTLKHPGIVRVHDIGETEGLLFLVMELLDGETLKDRLAREKKLSPEEAKRILSGILDALGVAHAAGVLHRDIKPGNIFLSQNRVVLLDFGLARAAPDPRLTATGQFLGTPEYVSPEQAKGDRDLGPPSDLYSTGIVLWEMLSGSPPFTGDSAVDIITAHLARPLPDPRKTMASTPGYLRDLATWMIEKNPRRRPKDPATVLSSLKRNRPKRLLRRLVRRTAGKKGRIRISFSLVVIALSLVVAWFPAGIEVHNGVAEARSRLGLKSWSWTFPFEVVDAKPISPSAVHRRNWLLLLGPPKGTRREFPSEYPLGILSADIVTGQAKGLPLVLNSIQTLLPQPFPHMNRFFKGRNFLQIGGSPSSWVALFNHLHYPNNILHFNMERHGTVLPHPGAIYSGCVVVPKTSEDEKLLILSGENHDLGQRAVVFGLSLEDGPLIDAGYTFAPYEVYPELDRETRFYTLFSKGRTPIVKCENNVIQTTVDNTLVQNRF